MAAQPETTPPEDVQPETAPPEITKPEKKAKPEEAKLEDAKPGKAKLVKVKEEDAKPEKAAWRRSLPFQKRASDQKPESLWQLPLTAKQGLAAATTQCISLAALCVAISYLSWVELEYRAHSDDRLVMRWAVSYTFGVPFSLHSAYWLNTSAEEFNPVAPNFWEQDIMLWARDDWTQVDGIIAGSILALITGFTSFLLDFIEVKKLGRTRLIVAVALHILTAFFTAFVLGMCVSVLSVVRRAVAERGLPKKNYVAVLGVSFYLTTIAFALASLASLFAIWALLVYRKEPAPSCPPPPPPPPQPPADPAQSA